MKCLERRGLRGGLKRWGKVAMYVLGAVGLWMVFTLGMIAWHGGGWSMRTLWGAAWEINNPKRRMLVAAVAWIGAYLLSRPTRREQWIALGRVSLAGMVVVAGIGAGEITLRHVLRKARGGGGDLKALEEHQTGRSLARVSGSHPLADIVGLSPNKKLGYELLPGMDRDFGHTRVRTNAEGMRADVDYMRAKPPDVVRIVGVGDSGMFGWSVEQGENYMAVLERRLASRAGGKVEVLNFAVPGYNTYQELEMLRHKGLAYDPDIVIVGWCDNDFGLPFFLLRAPSFDRPDVSYLYALVFNRRHFRDLVMPQALKAREVDLDRVDPELVQYADVAGVRKAMTELRDLGRARGFHVLIWGPMNAAAEQIFEETGVAYVNILRHIPRDAYPADWLVHFMHPRAQGHAVLAEYLERELDRRGWLKNVAVASGADE